MTRLQLARLIRFTLNPSKEDLPEAYYVVDNKDVEPVYRRYNLRQLRQFSKERLVEMIVDYLLKEDDDGQQCLSVFYQLVVAELLLVKESELTLLSISRWCHFADEHKTMPVWAALAWHGDLPGSLTRIRTEMERPEFVEQTAVADYRQSDMFSSRFWSN